MSEFQACQLILSSQGYNEKVESVNGKGVKWTTSVLDELPIRMPATGLSSQIKPDTIPNVFKLVRDAR